MASERRELEEGYLQNAFLSKKKKKKIHICNFTAPISSRGKTNLFLFSYKLLVRERERESVTHTFFLTPFPLPPPLSRPLPVSSPRWRQRKGENGIFWPVSPHCVSLCPPWPRVCAARGLFTPCGLRMEPGLGINIFTAIPFTRHLKTTNSSVLPTIEMVTNFFFFPPLQNILTLSLNHHRLCQFDHQGDGHMDAQHVFCP